MNIALFHNLASGGAKRCLFEQSRELAARGCTMHEYTLSTASIDFLSLSGHAEATSVFQLPWKHLARSRLMGIGPYLHLCWNSLNLFRLKQLSRKIAAVIDQADFDLVLVHDCRFTVAPFILRFLNTPSVLYLNSVPGRLAKLEEMDLQPFATDVCMRVVQAPKKYHQRMVQSITSVNLHSASKVLTNSNFARRLMLTSENVDAQVVYPGVDTRIFRPVSVKSSDSCVLSVGALNPSKGHELIIDSLALLSETLRPRLIIASPVADPIRTQKILQYANARNVRVQLEAALATGELVALYSSASIFAFASQFEPLGLAVIEAMACGTPVVAVNEGGPQETVLDGQTGLLVPRDSHHMAEAFARLLCDPVRRHHYGTHARRYVESSWSWSKSVDELERHLVAVSAHTSIGVA